MGSTHSSFGGCHVWDVVAGSFSTTRLVELSTVKANYMVIQNTGDYSELNDSSRLFLYRSLAFHVLITHSTHPILFLSVLGPILYHSQYQHQRNHSFQLNFFSFIVKALFGTVL
jgi:hypothetical protein